MAGRKSAAALSVIAGNFDGRPRAPDFLTDFQRELWDRTVTAEPADQFKTAALQQLLTEYCRHTETAHRLSEQVDRATAMGSNMSIEDLEKLLRCRDRETKALADKATKLRLTNQSRWQPKTAASKAQNAGAERKPWQMAG